MELAIRRHSRGVVFGLHVVEVRQFSEAKGREGVDNLKQGYLRVVATRVITAALHHIIVVVFSVIVDHSDLELSGNQLTGAIPTAISAAASLVYVYLSSNQLSGGGQMTRVG